jgi:adenylate cyclase
MVHRKGVFQAYLLYLLGFLIAVAFAFLFLIKPAFLHTFDLKLYDLMFGLRGQIRPPNLVVIAAIDEWSISRLGRWPWSRDKFASLVKRLSDYGASVIAFDVIFSEPEINDSSLAESIDSAGCVILPVVFFFEEGESACDPLFNSSLPVKNPEMFSRYAPASAKKVLCPVPKIAKSASGFGHINLFPDPDGVIRKEALYMEYKGYLIPCLSIKTAAFYLGIPNEKIIIDATKGVYLGKRYIPTDPHGRILIHYYGTNESFKYISIVDILDGKVKKEEIEEKIVLIGAVAVGIHDLKVTPTSSALPGIEKHANVIASIIEGRYIVPLKDHYVIAIILLSGLLATLLYNRLRAAYSLGVLILFLSFFFFLSYSLFLSNVWLSQFYIFSSLFSEFIVTIAVRYAISEKEARWIRRIFSSYVTERVVNELIKNPSLARLGGERREVTILFSDIRGFTSLSEKIAPEEVVRILNEYFGKMTEVILKWEGTLDKFMGDAIMVFWGAPLNQEDHAERAIRCAIDMLKEARSLSERWKEEGGPPLRIGVGINTGEVLVGNIGAEGKKMDYTVIGDHVNLASRLEGLNKKFNTDLIISEFTLEKVRSLFENGLFGPYSARGIGNVIVKGKERPVRIYTILEKIGEEASIVEPEEEIIVMDEK